MRIMHFNDISIRQLSFSDSGQVKYRDDTLPGFSLIAGKRIKTFFVMHSKQHQTKIIDTYLDICLKDVGQEAKRILTIKLSLKPCRRLYSLPGRVNTKVTEPNLLKALKAFDAAAQGAM